MSILLSLRLLFAVDNVYVAERFAAVVALRSSHCSCLAKGCQDCTLLGSSVRTHNQTLDTNVSSTPCLSSAAPMASPPFTLTLAGCDGVVVAVANFGRSMHLPKSLSLLLVQLALLRPCHSCIIIAFSIQCISYLVFVYILFVCRRSL